MLRPLVSKPGPDSFQILKQIWHDTWLDVMLAPLHALALKNKLKVWNFLSIRHDCLSENFFIAVGFSQAPDIFPIVFFLKEKAMATVGCL